MTISPYAVGNFNNVFDNITTDTIGEPIYISDKLFKNLYVAGTNFAGGTFYFEWSLDGEQWIVGVSPSGTPLSTTVPIQFTSLPLFGAQWRGRFAGSTGTANLSARFQ